MALTSAQRAAQWQSARVSTRIRAGRVERLRTRARALSGRAANVVTRARSASLVLGGFSSLVTSVFTAWGTAPGLASLGVACFLIEYLTGTGEGK